MNPVTPVRATVLSAELMVFLFLETATTCCLVSARFWLIITNVERKIASSETIIVSRP